MLPENTFTDKETQVIKVALQVVNDILQERIQNKEPYKPMNEYDIMDPRYTLMHTLTALTKITKQPIEHFQNPQQ
jgi:hypothetical protein